MLDNVFSMQGMTFTTAVMITVAASLLCGIIIAAVYRAGAYRPSKYMTVSIIIMPTIVQSVIMLVNGSIGAGVAVAGAFSLVRFRSVPGNSRDICVLFLAMAAGISSGMGFPVYALCITVIIGVILLVSEKIIPSRYTPHSRQLRIILPEDMDYSGLFDDILDEYTAYRELNSVRTVRMGTMYELIYVVTMKSEASEKEMLDKIRCRNGNLTVGCSIIPDNHDEL